MRRKGWGANDDPVVKIETDAEPIPCKSWIGNPRKATDNTVPRSCLLCVFGFCPAIPACPIYKPQVYHPLKSLNWLPATVALGLGTATPVLCLSTASAADAPPPPSCEAASLGKVVLDLAPRYLPTPPPPAAAEEEDGTGPGCE